MDNTARLLRRDKIVTQFDKLGHLSLPEIPVTMGKFQNLGKCHINARQALEDGSTHEIAACVYLTPKGFLRYHFIEKHGDTYIDNTLGYLSKKNRYFLVATYTLADVEAKDMDEFINESIYAFLDRLFTKVEQDQYKFELTDL